MTLSESGVSETYTGTVQVGVTAVADSVNVSASQTSQFVATLEHRQGLKIACLEEISYNCGLIDKEELAQLASETSNNSYGNYLRSLVNT